jgi:hypothetical protein
MGVRSGMYAIANGVEVRSRTPSAQAQNKRPHQTVLLGGIICLELLEFCDRQACNLCDKLHRITLLEELKGDRFLSFYHPLLLPASHCLHNCLP